MLVNDIFLLYYYCIVLLLLYTIQFRAEKGALPEAGVMEQAEAVFGLAKACNEEDGGFKAEGLDDSKVRQCSVV